MKFVAPVFFLFILLLPSCSNVSESDWLGPDRNGTYPDVGLLEEWPEEGPELLWQFNDLNMGHSSPALSENAIYVTGMPDSTTGILYCLDLNGNLQWQEKYGNEFKTYYTGSRSSPVIRDHELYTISGAGEIICFDLKRRQTKWTRELLHTFSDSLPTYGHSQSLVVDHKNLYCIAGGKDHSVICLNRKTGKLRWSCSGNRGNPSYSSPILIRHNGHKIIVAVTEIEILGIAADDGELLWSIPYESVYIAHINTPVYNNGKIYMASGSDNERGGLIAIELNQDASAASVSWERRDIKNTLSGILVEDEKLFTSVYRKKDWLCLDPSTGKTIKAWEGLPYGNITYADHHYYVLSANGIVSLCRQTNDSLENISSFKPDISIWDPFAPLWSFPVIKDKVLYIRHQGKLFAYNIAK